MADNYKNTIKKNLDVITGANSTFFTGVDDLVNLNFDPIVTGYAFIHWIQLPSWFEQDDDLKYFKLMSQRNFKGFGGVEDVTLTTVTQQTGFANAEFDIAAGVTRGNTGFSLTHKEFSGGVMRKMYQKWITYIRDPRTGIALYPKLFNIAYGARNHTGQLIYITVRPDVTNTDSDIIEYAAFYSNVMPTNVPLSTLYNYTQGTQETNDITIEFKGFVEIGPDVEAYAARVLKEQIVKSSENADGIPFADSFGTNENAKPFSVGTLKDIY